MHRRYRNPEDAELHQLAKQLASDAYTKLCERIVQDTLLVLPVLFAKYNISEPLQLQVKIRLQQFGNELATDLTDQLWTNFVPRATRTLAALAAEAAPPAPSRDRPSTNDDELIGPSDAEMERNEREAFEVLKRIADEEIEAYLASVAS